MFENTTHLPLVWKLTMLSGWAVMEAFANSNSLLPDLDLHNDHPPSHDSQSMFSIIMMSLCVSNNSTSSKVQRQNLYFFSSLWLFFSFVFSVTKHPPFLLPDDTSTCMPRALEWSELWNTSSQSDWKDALNFSDTWWEHNIYLTVFFCLRGLKACSINKNWFNGFYSKLTLNVDHKKGK